MKSRIAGPSHWPTADRSRYAALILDLAACDRNLARMAEFFRDRPAKLRPHFKNHKCVTLAKRQLAAGAIGITCAKLSEAEVLVAGGVADVLIANQVVGPLKVARLARLAREAKSRVAVDHSEQVEGDSPLRHARPAPKCTY